MDFERKPGLMTGEPVPVRQPGRVAIEARMIHICLDELSDALGKVAKRLVEEVGYVRRLIRLLPPEY